MSLVETRMATEQLLHCIMGSHERGIKHPYTNHIKHWQSCLDRELERRLVCTDPSEKKGAHLLRMNMLRFSINRQLSRDSDGRDADIMNTEQANDSFREMVESAKEVVALDRTPGPKAPRFSLDEGIAGPLFYVCRYCRDPLIRRDAVRLLESTDRQDNIWNNRLVARACKTLIGLEEREIEDPQSSRDIPFETRIGGMELELQSGSKSALIKYEIGERWISQRIEWE